MNNKLTLSKRIKTMLLLDFKRLFKTPLFYIMVGVAVVIPVLVLVMTTMMDGSTTTNPQTGEVTVIEGFDNVWQSIDSISGTSTGMSMDLTSMCNINLLYFLILVVGCLFIGNDYRSGYVKNLFTSRSKKIEYVLSKTITCFFVSSLMVIGYFVGALLGGKVSGLSFELVDVTFSNVLMCVLSKIFLTLIFVSISVVMSITAKNSVWLSILASFAVSMLLYTMIPMISPLNSTIMNVGLSIAIGILFSIGIGLISNLILKKSNIL